MKIKKIIPKEPLVSIIMNCHNGEKYLKKSVSSIINQSYRNWELIFWDNKSSDNSAKILKNFKDINGMNYMDLDALWDTLKNKCHKKNILEKFDPEYWTKR